MKLIILFLICLLVIVRTDPQPTGGAPCQYNDQCGGINVGFCEPNQNSSLNGTCICPTEYGNPDCSYERKSRKLCGGLQFLCFVGIGGVGNFILGRTGPAIAQLVLELSSYTLCIIGCISYCIMSIKKKLGIVIFGLLICITSVASMAGFIWSIVDGAEILEGNIVDGNGYSTY